MRRRIAALLFTTVALGVAAGAASAWATVYDLQSDWSDSADPNGPWAYYTGATLLPSDSNWTAYGGCVQPGFARDNGGNFLPAVFQAACTNGLALNVGDIITHTLTGGSGFATDAIDFTAPSDGTAEISGSLHTVRDIGRAQDWEVLVNGVGVASGTLSDNDFTAETFDLLDVNLTTGDQVQLEMYAPGGTGDFIDIGMTINLDASAAPEPASLAVFGAGLTGLGFVKRRRRT